MNKALDKIDKTHSKMLLGLTADDIAKSERSVQQTMSDAAANPKDNPWDWLDEKPAAPRIPTATSRLNLHLNKKKPTISKSEQMLRAAVATPSTRSPSPNENISDNLPKPKLAKVVRVIKPGTKNKGTRKRARVLSVKKVGRGKKSRRRTRRKTRRKRRKTRRKRSRTRRKTKRRRRRRKHIQHGGAGGVELDNHRQPASYGFNKETDFSIPRDSYPNYTSNAPSH